MRLNLNKKNVLIASFTILFVISLFNLLWSLFCQPLLILNENQILYLFSTIAQVIAGIFGLTLAAYVFFLDKFKASAQADETYYDATISLVYKYYLMFLLISIICGSVILSSILGISIINTSSNNAVIVSFMINQTSILFIIEIISILFFGIMILNPEKQRIIEKQ